MWCGTLCGAHEAETLTLAQAQVQGPLGPLGLDPQQVQARVQKLLQAQVQGQGQGPLGLEPQQVLQAQELV
jgi:hypothetical protein